MRGEGWEGVTQVGNELCIVSKLYSRGNGTLKSAVLRNEGRRKRKATGR